jgi:hypothetical protein
MERMERERVNPATERENARNMALLQAGLAIAGGTSPHFAQNLAGAIPAIQGYQTQMTNLRKEGRDELKAQFDLAKADVETQYHQGMLTEHQRSSAISRLNAELQARTNLETTRMQVAGHIQSAGIAAGGRDRDLTYEQFSRLPPDEQRAYQQYKGRDPDARQNAQTDRVTNMYVQRIEGLNRNEAEQLRGVVLPDQRKAITERFAAERRQLDSLFRSRGVVIPEVEQPAAGSSSMQTFPLFPERR